MKAHFLPLCALTGDDHAGACTNARVEANAGEYPAMRMRSQSAPLKPSVLVSFALMALMLAEIPLASPRFERPAGVADANEPLIAAGYRALFTCSAYFFSGRKLADIERVELVDTAPLRLPAPEIDETRQLVAAADGAGNVQVAAYRDSMGCTLLPPHWDEADLPRLPYVAYPDAPDVRDVPFPRGDATDLGRDGLQRSARGLRNVIEQAFNGTSYGKDVVTVGIVVVRDGEIIAERYRPGFGVHKGYRTWSTAKSITAALLGIAARKGLLDLDAPAAIPEWQYPGDPRRAITYKHLLWMSSGLSSGGNNTYAVYFGGQDVVSAVTTTPLEVEPGSRWKYANNDTLLLLRALRHVLGSDLQYLRFPYDELLHRIGMFHTRMETDHLGNFIGSSQVYTTARDLARFGVLLANDGVWEGERLLPEDWVRFSRMPAPAKPVEPGTRGYGAQFWLLGSIAGIPEDTYTTAGNKGQYVTVLPSGLVIVRTGVDPLGTSWEHERFVADVISELNQAD
ncbi:MAG TPA: serine hydrolase [Woeseiaceae bacterium]|nr:serine hydrolase [Woeseiaceae bacterium]